MSKEEDKRSKGEGGSPEVPVSKISSEIPVFRVSEEKILRGFSDPASTKEFTASIVAVVLLTGFLATLIIPLIILYQIGVSNPANYATAAATTEDLIKTDSAVLSGLVGAVLVYYFGVTKKSQGSE